MRVKSFFFPSWNDREWPGISGNELGMTWNYLEWPENMTQCTDLPWNRKCYRVLSKGVSVCVCVWGGCVCVYVCVCACVRACKARWNKSYRASLEDANSWKKLDSRSHTQKKKNRYTYIQKQRKKKIMFELILKKLPIYYYIYFFYNFQYYFFFSSIPVNWTKLWYYIDAHLFTP